MSGKSVAKLAFACFLSSCYYPTPVVVVVNPGSVHPGSGGGGGYRVEGPQVDGPPYTTPRGNCVQFTSGSTKICYWSLNSPMCQVPITDCENITNKCQTPTTSKPPPC